MEINIIFSYFFAILMICVFYIISLIIVEMLVEKVDNLMHKKIMK